MQDGCHTSLGFKPLIVKLLSNSYSTYRMGNPKKRVMLQDAMEIFRDVGEELTRKGKGIQPSSLGEPWHELASVFQRYITCDGRLDVVIPRQLKLLAILKQNLTVNLPSFLNSLLHDTADRIRWARHPETVVSHHGLIRLIVSHNLVQQNLTWDSLIAPLEIS